VAALPEEHTALFCDPGSNRELTYVIFRIFLCPVELLCNVLFSMERVLGLYLIKFRNKLLQTRPSTYWSFTTGQIFINNARHFSFNGESIFTILRRLWAGQCRNLCSIPGRVKRSSLLQGVQTGSAANTTSYPRDRLFPEKWSGWEWSWPHTSI
jgi:hypothetical protein